ncbi:hypothetical protein [Acinetobacter seifertii]|uniref:hypothetical protein n=1 Tax=Acinetobacter seifertii TaxID=1530123 RepID=UPI001250A282|nr:hypothetical protein [Acinetobacter seifertii]
MLSFYFVDIQPPKLTSPDWYKSFYNMFYLSQLTNTLLLSYMKTFAQNEADGMIKHYPEILINKGIMDNSKNIEDIEEVYSLEVEAFLKQILYEFDNRLSGLNASTIPMGFQIEGLRNCKRELDFNQLFKLTGSKNWYTAIKGFLSLWEFLFLYSDVC